MRGCGRWSREKPRENVYLSPYTILQTIPLRLYKFECACVCVCVVVYVYLYVRLWPYCMFFPVTHIRGKAIVTIGFTTTRSLQMLSESSSLLCAATDDRPRFPTPTITPALHVGSSTFYLDVTVFVSFSKISSFTSPIPCARSV